MSQPVSSPAAPADGTKNIWKPGVAMGLSQEQTGQLAAALGMGKPLILSRHSHIHVVSIVGMMALEAGNESPTTMSKEQLQALLRLFGMVHHTDEVMVSHRRGSKEREKKGRN
jgi:hypothetical protein